MSLGFRHCNPHRIVNVPAQQLLCTILSDWNCVSLLDTYTMPHIPAGVPFPTPSHRAFFNFRTHEYLHQYRRHLTII